MEGGEGGGDMLRRKTDAQIGAPDRGNGEGGWVAKENQEHEGRLVLPQRAGRSKEQYR